MSITIKNKEVLQSYILTTAKYDFSVYEKRILYRIIELNQNLIEGKKLSDRYQVNSTLFKSKEYVMPISAFLTTEDSKTDKNHSRIKKALKGLQQKIIEYEDEDVDRSAGIVFNVEINKTRTENITFYVADFIYQALMDFSKGYRKYELKVAMQFESIYAMRFYELFSAQKTPINYSIDKLKEMFGITDKYKENKDFIKYVIVSAKKELDKCSPYTFHYETIKTGRKITSIHFVPIYQPQFEDEDIKKQNLNKQMSNRWFIPKNIEDYLTHNFQFTERELNNNLNLFESVYKYFSEEETLDFLAEIREPSSYADNRKGFIIGALKKKVEKKFEEIYLK